MNLFDSIARLERLLDFHLERHAVLAANVANVETPGFVAKDLRFRDALAAAESGLGATHPAHFGSAAGPAGGATEIVDDPAPEAGDRGATIEREMAKVSANAVRYEMAAELVRRRLALVRYAASDGERP